MSWLGDHLVQMSEGREELREGADLEGCVHPFTAGVDDGGHGEREEELEAVPDQLSSAHAAASHEYRSQSPRPVPGPCL